MLEDRLRSQVWKGRVGRQGSWDPLNAQIKYAVSLFQAISDRLGCFLYAKLSKVQPCVATGLMSVQGLDIGGKMQRCNSAGARLAHKNLVF